jgi:hypothetical protein
MSALPTADFVRQILDYNPETGVFRWKARTPEMFRDTPKRSKEHACANWNSRYAGELAGGHAHNGYVSIAINNRKYYAHRLAWFYMKGEWPINSVDHADMGTSNNAFANLREATQSQNMRNIRHPRNNTSGVKGVYWNSAAGRWCASFHIHRKHIHIGLFDSIEEATDALSKAMVKHFGAFARIG